MRAWLLLSLALPGTALADEGVDVASPTSDVTGQPDSAVYEQAWRPIQDGPPGCWEVVGRASWDWNGARFGGSEGDSAFVGRLEDGVWTGFHIRSLGEDRRERRRPTRRVYDHGRQTFVPLVGRRTPTDYGEDMGENALAFAVGELGSSVDYAYVERAADGVLLKRTIPFDDSSDRTIAMDVFFPGDETLPVAADVTFPDRFPVPRFRLAKVHDAEAHIRAKIVGGMVFPEVETFRFDVKVLGLSMSGAQTIQYRSFRPCGGSADEVDTPVLP